MRVILSLRRTLDSSKNYLIMIILIKGCINKIDIASKLVEKISQLNLGRLLKEAIDLFLLFGNLTMR